MRRFLYLAILSLYFNSTSHAQSELNFDIALDFVQQKVQHFNVKIYEAVMNEEIPAYMSDSLATEISTEQIIDWSARKKKDGDSLISTPLDPNTELLGLNYYYSREQKVQTTSFELVSIAPLYHPILISGIELGLQPVFHIRYSDLTKILNDAELQEFHNLLELRSSLGDFMNVFTQFSKSNYDYAAQISSNRHYSEVYYNGFTPFYDSAFAYYLINSFSTFTKRHFNDGGVFYQDPQAQIEYENFYSEIMTITETVMVQNPDSRGDDDNELMEVTLKLLYDFGFTELFVSKSTLRKVIKVNVEIAEGTIRSYYIRFNDLSAYMDEVDEYFLKQLLEFKF